MKRGCQNVKYSMKYRYPIMGNYLFVNNLLVYFMGVFLQLEGPTKITEIVNVLMF